MTAWRKWYEPKCPAVAWVGRDNWFHCDLAYAHDGEHIAERGMDEPHWTENFIA